MQFNSWRHTRVVIVSALVLGVTIIALLKTHFAPSVKPLEQRASFAKCSFGPQRSSVSQSWKLYINEQRCFSFLYPAGADFEIGNKGTPFEFVQARTLDWQFAVGYQPTETLRNISGPSELLQNLVHDSEFTGYKEFAGINWIEHTESREKDLLRSYHAIKNNYYFTVSEEQTTRLQNSGTPIPDAILQTFQFSD